MAICNSASAENAKTDSLAAFRFTPNTLAVYVTRLGHGTITAMEPEQGSVKAREYRLCESDNGASLSEGVTELLSQGWELYGQPFIDSLNYEDEFQQPKVGRAIFQALIKR